MSPKKSTMNQVSEHQRLLLESMSEGVYGLDAQGLATFVNPAAERLTGWEASDLIGKSIHEFHHHSHADGRHYPQSECPIYQCLQDGITRTKENEVFWRKDGTSFAVEYSATPILQDGSIQGAIVVFKNISDRKRMESALQKALTENRFLKEKLEAENSYLQSEIESNYQSEIIGQSAAIEHLQTQIAMAAPTNANILIQGESGTGKELVARAIHQQSERKDQTLVKLNCGAIPEGLVDSELFGHEKGAFTGAMKQRIGRFELAHKGTLFLDEVSELPLDAQVKLLRVLQEGEFERVGGNKTIKVDVRIIAASNKNLENAVRDGSFRLDLYYRLNVFSVQVPALRERKSDFPILSHFFAAKACAAMGKTFKGLHTPSLKWMSHYHWPGNIRELSNWIEHNAILHTGGLFHIHPMTHIRNEQNTEHENESIVSLAEAEKQHIQKALLYCNGRIAGANGAAQLLKLPASTLRSKMKKLDIQS